MALQSHLKKFLPYLLLIILSFLLIPRGFEVGAETWKVWGAAGLLNKLGVFSKFTMGPIYYLYLQPFLFLNFPFSLKLEFLITHLFCFTSLYLFSRRYFKNKYLSLLLVAAWIPELTYLVSTKCVMGLAFFLLYFEFDFYSRKPSKMMSPLLAIAALCNAVYWPFFIVDFLGRLFSTYQNRKTLNYADLKPSKTFLTFIIFFVVLIVSVFSFSAERKDDNTFMTGGSYWPVNVKSHFQTAFFQIGAQKEIERKFSRKEYADLDWYNYHKDVWGGAQNIFEAFQLRRDLVIENLISNIKPSLMYAAFFFQHYGNYWMSFKYGPSLYRIFTLIVLFMIFCGAIGFTVKLCKEANVFGAITVWFGTLTLISVLYLTYFSTRYMLPLLPIFFLFNFHIASSINLIISKLKWRFLYKKFSSECIISLSIFLVLISNSYPKGWSSQIESLLKGWPILKSFDSHYVVAEFGPRLIEMFEREDKVILLEDSWAKGFTRLNPNNVYSPFELPPFSGREVQIFHFLETLDFIAVSNEWMNMKSPTTNAYIRYKIYIVPFLKENIDKWDQIDIESFGTVYKRKEVL